MARTKHTSNVKQQMGQFMTPLDLCRQLIKKYTFKDTDRILEPSMGDGNFIIAIIEKYIGEVYTKKEPTIDKINRILTRNLSGIELDEVLFEKCKTNIQKHFKLKKNDDIIANFHRADFLTWVSVIDNKFDYIIGNPPFGGTIDMTLHQELEKKYGIRYDKKIKKETYSFFIIKCIEEHLKDNAILLFILSDTFMTIKTMNGLRLFLGKEGYNIVRSINRFSDETLYSMVTLEFWNNIQSDHITYDGNDISMLSMESTGNYSWYMPTDLEKYFGDKTIGDFMTGSGGLTTGNNELFVRTIKDNKIIEDYDFSFWDRPINLAHELFTARWNRLSDRQTKKIQEKEKNGETVRDVSIIKKNPIEIELPHPDYKFYNKSDGKLIYSKPKYVIYWKDDGDAVITYKKNGRWHLKGVGGLKFFGKEGITWQFISTEIKPRYLPEGYILDNSGPILIPKKGVDKNELYFILAWLTSSKATSILKEVLNHTRNIQAKDLERLPYPFWVKDEEKNMIINETINVIKYIIEDENYNLTDYKKTINKVFGN